MPKSRAKTIRVYDLTCDQCQRTGRHEVEGPVERAAPIREPFTATSDEEAMHTDGEGYDGWRTLFLKPIAGSSGIGRERSGFVCSGRCARAWATRNALPDPIEAKVEDA